MRTSSNYSSVVTVTFAELAWLAFFSVLFLLARTERDNGKLKDDLADVSAIMADVQAIVGEGDNIGELVQRLWDRNEELEAGTESTDGSEYSAEDVEVMRRDLERLRALVTENEVLMRNEAMLHVAQLAERDSEVEKLGERLAIAADENLRLERINEKLYRESEAILARNKSEFSVRQELLGIKVEELRRVVFALDCSSSMRQNNSENWNAAFGVMRDWIEFLPFDEVALVSFNSGTKQFPEPHNEMSGYLAIRSSEGEIIEERRELLLDYVSGLRVAAGTNTLEALKAAFRYEDTDLIVLFTDGRPEVGIFPSIARLQDEILEFATNNISAPIFVVALGNHDDRNLRFLKALSQLHPDGGFIAR